MGEVSLEGFLTERAAITLWSGLGTFSYKNFELGLGNTKTVTLGKLSFCHHFLLLFICSGCFFFFFTFKVRPLIKNNLALFLF